MFGEAKTEVMPGYTGHTKGKFEDEQTESHYEPRSHIPGNY